jgi:preprotein translocase subunit SecD
MRMVRLVGIGMIALLLPVAAFAEALKLRITDAYVDREGTIGIVMTDKSARDFFEFMIKNLSKVVIFRADGREIMRPIIGSPLPSGTGFSIRVHDTNLNVREARTLAWRLKSGQADFEVEAVEN